MKAKLAESFLPTPLESRGNVELRSCFSVYVNLMLYKFDI